MNIDNGKIYDSKEEALKDGVSEDKIITGTQKAVDEVMQRLFPKAKRMKLK